MILCIFAITFFTDMLILNLDFSKRDLDKFNNLSSKTGNISMDV